MNCEEAQALLLGYLDGEVTPSERTLILAHLSGCSVCQQELDLLSTARSQVRSALQRRAVHAVPSREAWSRLEARLTETAQPSSKFMAWLSRRAPNAGRVFNQLLGGVTMQKRWIFSGLAGVIMLSALAVLLAQTVTPVSARQILDRAYQAQSMQNQGEGIHHTRVETYHNICALPEDQGESTVIESYLDLQAGYFRTVITEAQTGNALDVFAFDGSHIYSGHRLVPGEAKDPQQGSEPRPKRFVCEQPFGTGTDASLTVYRGAQNNVAAVNVPANEEAQTHEEIFRQMQDDPNAELLGEETWIDGRKVYVLRSWQPVKALVDGNMDGSKELPLGWVTSYFDVETYRLVESRAAIERDGEEILVYSYRALVDEILPSRSDVPWDLSDLGGITIVDDPEGQYVDLLPEVISEEELASHAPSAYLLETIPAGYTLEISASPKQPADQPYFFVASYRNQSDDYFVIQALGSKEVEFITEGATETYTTASGLVLTFMDDFKEPSGKQFTSAVLETPDGAAFLLNSTLPRETVKALAENLVLVK
jgi:hypothetical protein